MTFLKLILIVMLVIIFAHGVLIHKLLNDVAELKETADKHEEQISELEDREFERKIEKHGSSE